MSMYESNASGSRVHTNKTFSVSEYEEINKSFYEWYTLACSKNMAEGKAELRLQLLFSLRHLEGRKSLYIVI